MKKGWRNNSKLFTKSEYEPPIQYSKGEKCNRRPKNKGEMSPKKHRSFREFFKKGDV